MRPAIIISLSLLLLTSACVRLASTAPPMTGRNLFTPAAAARLCGAADLQTSSNAHEDQGAISLGVTFINQSKSPCDLQNLPQVSLLEAGSPGAGSSGAGRALEVQLVQTDEGSSPAAALTVSPGESAILILVWRNYCGATLKDGPVIRLALGNGENLKFQADASAVPRCEAANNPSTLGVNPYSYPP